MKKNWAKNYSKIFVDLNILHRRKCWRLNILQKIKKKLYLDKMIKSSQGLINKRQMFGQWTVHWRFEKRSWNAVRAAFSQLININSNFILMRCRREKKRPDLLFRTWFSLNFSDHNDSFFVCVPVLSFRLYILVLIYHDQVFEL